MAMVWCVNVVCVSSLVTLGVYMFPSIFSSCLVHNIIYNMFEGAWVGRGVISISGLWLSIISAISLSLSLSLGK